MSFENQVLQGRAVNRTSANVESVEGTRNMIL